MRKIKLIIDLLVWFVAHKRLAFRAGLSHNGEMEFGDDISMYWAIGWLACNKLNCVSGYPIAGNNSLVVYMALVDFDHPKCNVMDSNWYKITFYYKKFYYMFVGKGKDVKELFRMLRSL